MTDVVIRLRKIAEDLSVAVGYNGYVRTLIEACAEIENLRTAKKRMTSTMRTLGPQKGKRSDPRR